MNYYALLPFLALLVVFHPFFILALKKEKSAEEKSALSFFACIICWLILDIFNWFFITQLVIIRLKIISIFWIIAGFFYLNFIYVFIKKKKNIIYYIFFIYDLVAIIVSLFTNLIIDGYNKYYWGIDLKHGILFGWTVITVNMFPVLYSIYIIIKRTYNNKENNRNKQRLIILVFGTLLSVFVSYTIDIILPFLSNFYFPRLDPIIMTFPVLLVYLVVKKKKYTSLKSDEAVNYLFDYMDDGVIITDNKSNIIKINESAKLIFSLEEKELYNLKITHIIPEYDYNATYHNHELDPLLHKKYISLSHSKIIIENIDLGRIIIIRDITDQKFLSEVWRRYEFIVDTAKDFMALVDEDYKYTVVNKSFCDALNKKESEIINKPVSFFWGNKVFNSIIKNHLERCFDGETVNYKNWINFEQQRKRYIELLYYPYYNLQNKVTHCVIIGHDITEQKRGEDIIKESHLQLEEKVKERTVELENINKSLLDEIKQREKAEEEILNAHSRIQQLLSSVTSILISITVDRKITHFNPTAENVFKIKAESVVNKCINEISITWEKDKINNGIDECVREKSAIRLDIISYKRKEGKNGLLGLNLSPILNRSNKIEGVLIWGADITERKALETQLAQSQKLESIGQLAAGIAHEINTPVQYIGDNLHFFNDSYQDFNELFNKYHLLIEELKSNNITIGDIDEIIEKEKKIDLEFLMDEIPKAVTQSLEGIDRVSKIVKSMRDFSHPGVEEKAQIDINNAIESTIIISKNEWKYVADLKTDFDKSLPLVSCYPGEINQVFLNIIVNAAHAIEDAVKETPDRKGLITISTKSVDNFIEIKISDTGSGIPEKIKNRIFDQFFTTKEVGKGTGQGLAIAHSVITERHNGTITFESEIGKGTTFIIRLPL